MDLPRPILWANRFQPNPNVREWHSAVSLKLYNWKKLLHQNWTSAFRQMDFHGHFLGVRRAFMANLFLHPRTCALGQNPKQNQIIIKRTLSLNILIVSSILLKRWYSLENYHYFCFFQFHFKLNMVRILVYFCI